MRNLDLPTFSIFLWKLRRQVGLEHLHIRGRHIGLSAGKFNTQCCLQYDFLEPLMSHVDCYLAEYVKSIRNVLPDQIVAIVAGLTTPPPIRQGFLMDARFPSSQRVDGGFLKGIENNEHALN